MATRRRNSHLGVKISNILPLTPHPTKYLVSQDVRVNQWDLDKITWDEFSGLFVLLTTKVCDMDLNKTRNA